MSATFPREQNSWISTIFLDMKRLKRSTGYRFVSESNHAQESHTYQFCLFFLCNTCRTTVSWDPEILLPWQRDVTTSSLLSWNRWSRDGWSWKNLNHVSWVKEKPQSLGHPLDFFCMTPWGPLWFYDLIKWERMKRLTWHVNFFFLCHICRTTVGWDPEILLPWQRDVTTSSLLSWNGWSRDGWSWKTLNHVSWVKEKPQSLGHPLYIFLHDALTSSLIFWFD